MKSIINPVLVLTLGLLIGSGLFEVHGYPQSEDSDPEPPMVAVREYATEKFQELKKLFHHDFCNDLLELELTTIFNSIEQHIESDSQDVADGMKKLFTDTINKYPQEYLCRRPLQCIANSCELKSNRAHRSADEDATTAAPELDDAEEMPATATPQKESKDKDSKSSGTKAGEKLNKGAKDFAKETGNFFKALGGNSGSKTFPSTLACFTTSFFILRRFY